MLSPVCCARVSVIALLLPWIFSFGSSEPAVLLTHSLQMQNKEGEGPMFVVTRKYLHNPIPVELKPMHCGAPFTKRRKLCIGRGLWFLYHMWCYFWGSRKKRWVKCELCTRCHTRVQSVLLLFSWQVKTLPFKLMKWLIFIFLSFELKPCRKCVVYKGKISNAEV